MSSGNQKLEEALKILGEEYKSELPPNYLKQAVTRKQVNEQQVYDALEEQRFEWNQGEWKKRAAPSWIKDAIQQYEKIILTKEFCEEALTTIEKFILALDFVARQLGTSGKPTKSVYLQ